MNSPASFSPSLPTKEHVAMAMTDKHHPAVKNRVAMKKYSQLFLLYSQQAMVKLCLFYRRYPRCSSVRLSSLTSTCFNTELGPGGPINQDHDLGENVDSGGLNGAFPKLKHGYVPKTIFWGAIFWVFGFGALGRRGGPVTQTNVPNSKIVIFFIQT